jgi:hypothetical protein
LTAGTQIIRVKAGSGGFNLGRLTFTYTGGGVSVTGVTVSPTSATLSPGATQQITATIAPNNATNKNVTWTSNNPAVATVNSTGLVTALASGTATITATTQDGSKTATSTITVTSTSVNLALNKPTTVSSTESATYPGSAAVDGSTTTRWASAFADPQYIYVDLGATYNVTRVKITWEAAYGRDYTVDVSSNTTSWTPIRTVTGNTALVNDWTGLNGTGRYIRIMGTARGTAYGYSIYELEVYGTASNTNTPPSVSILSPTAGATYTAPATINLSATASDSDGTINNVKFYRDGSTLIGQSSSTSSPYTFSWANVAVGTYSITAVATDNLGATKTSTAITITVNGTSSNCTQTSAHGDYTTEISKASSNPTLKFIPSRTGVGTPTVILYYGTSPTGNYPGYTVSPSTAYQITAAAGTVIYYYYTYSVPEGGERNTSASRKSFTVGSPTCPSARFAEAEAEAPIASEIIFPNPVDNTLFFTSFSEQTRVIIRSVNGAKVLESKITNQSIDLSSLQKGVYIIHIINGNSVTTKQFIKK